ncbi:unnamed protein product [Pedinophyceae sp. YPF-701]|nr:unnamed protein product [Pedinophyceae sp. YPF-701]
MGRHHQPLKPAGETLCRYYLAGYCQYGSKCKFSHDKKYETSTVCKFFLQGNCAYGNKCKFDHVKPEKLRQANEAATPSAGPSAGPGASASDRVRAEVGLLARDAPSEAPGAAARAPRPPQAPRQPGAAQPAASSGQDAATAMSRRVDGWVIHDDDEGGGWGETDPRAAGEPPSAPSGAWAQRQAGAGGDAELCMRYCFDGACEDGDACPRIHGAKCPWCGQWRSRGGDVAVRDPAAAPAMDRQHLAECEARQRRQEAVESSKDVECNICFETVVEKPRPSERMFGLLACEHPFCLKCIRAWRAKTDAGIDIKDAIRTCPLCRVVTHFVTPSKTWPKTPQDKAEVIQGYKDYLGTKDCRNFAFGQGTCPFGSSCFYRHAYKDGTVEEHRPDLMVNADGEVVPKKAVTLKGLLERPALGGRP